MKLIGGDVEKKDRVQTKEKKEQKKTKEMRVKEIMDAKHEQARQQRRGYRNIKKMERNLDEEGAICR